MKRRPSSKGEPGLTRLPRSNLMRLLTKRWSEPQTRQKGRRPLHGPAGAPRKKMGGAGGKKNAQRFAFPRTARVKIRLAERQIKHTKALHDAKNALARLSVHTKALYYARKQTHPAIGK